MANKAGKLAITGSEDSSTMEHYFFRIAGFVGWVRRVYAVPNITKPVTFKAVGLRDETANPTYEKTGVTGY